MLLSAVEVEAMVEAMVAPSSTKMVTVRRTLAASTAMLTASGGAPATRARVPLLGATQAAETAEAARAHVAGKVERAEEEARVAQERAAEAKRLVEEGRRQLEEARAARLSAEKGLRAAFPYVPASSRSTSIYQVERPRAYPHALYHSTMYVVPSTAVPGIYH